MLLPIEQQIVYNNVVPTHNKNNTIRSPDRHHQAQAFEKKGTSSRYATVTLTIDIGPVEIALLAGFVVALTAYIVSCRSRHRTNNAELLDLIRTIKQL